MNLTVQGLDELHRKVGQGASVLDSELRKSEHDALSAVRDAARDRVSEFSYILPRSVQIKTAPGGLSGAVGSVAKTILSIHEGRKPGQPPSYEQIQRWLSNRQATFDIGTHRRVTHQRTRLSKSLASAEQRDLRDEAVVIVQAIDRTGTKGHAFLIETGKSESGHVGRIFNDGIKRALRRIFG